MANDKEAYKQYKRLHICVRCAKEDAEFDEFKHKYKTKCAKCSSIQSARERNDYANNKQVNLFKCLVKK